LVPEPMSCPWDRFWKATRGAGLQGEKGALGEPRSTDRPHSAVDKRKNRKYAAAIPALPG